jgi:hypothetical protein
MAFSATSAIHQYSWAGSRREEAAELRRDSNADFHASLRHQEPSRRGQQKPIAASMNSPTLLFAQQPASHPGKILEISSPKIFQNYSDKDEHK